MPEWAEARAGTGRALRTTVPHDTRNGPGDWATTALLAGVAHDLASPIAALTSNLTIARELVDERGLSDDLRDVMDDLVMATRGLTRIGEDLRELARSEPTEPVSLLEVVHRALRLTRAITARRCSTALVGTSDVAASSPGAVGRWLCNAIVLLVHELGAERRAPMGELRIELTADGLALTMSPRPALTTATATWLEAAAATLGAIARVSHDGVGVSARLHFGVVAAP